MKLATLCYVRRDGRTLMIHRNKRIGDLHQGKWNGLGGKLDPGESPEQCVIREVREESGLHIRNPRYHGLLVFADFKNEDWFVWVFSATDFDGDLAETGEGALQWIPTADLTTLNLWPSDPIFFPWLEGGKTFSARFQYANEEMLGHEVYFY